MRKIPTLFERNPEDRRHVLPKVTPGCEWVAEGAGTPTRKWDGTCMMLDDAGVWWARREVKSGKNIPAGFRIEQHDETTGKLVGWEPVAQSPFARFHAQALEVGGAKKPGTYELVGPKVQGNPDGFDGHALIPHGYIPAVEQGDFAAAPRDFFGLMGWLLARPQYEGIVWHHPDGRMAKLKRRDFTTEEA